MKPAGVEWGMKMTLTGADGTIAVFNDESDPNYVGVLDPAECSGLDSADVREDMLDRVEDDGAIQGNNYFGRRPVILAGVIRGTTATQRNERALKLQQATNAMRDDAQLQWTPAGSVTNGLLINLRRQQPLRITGGFQKKFQASMVAADPRIYAATSSEETSAANVTQEPNNEGNAEAPMVITLTGPQTNPVIKNETTGEEIKLTHELAEGKTLTIDTLNHTVKEGTTNAYSSWNFTSSTWFHLGADGKTKLKCTTGSMKVVFRQAWL